MSYFTKKWPNAPESPPDSIFQKYGQTRIFQRFRFCHYILHLPKGQEVLAKLSSSEHTIFDSECTDTTSSGPESIDCDNSVLDITDSLFLDQLIGDELVSAQTQDFYFNASPVAEWSAAEQSVTRSTPKLQNEAQNEDDPFYKEESLDIELGLLSPSSCTVSMTPFHDHQWALSPPPPIMANSHSYGLQQHDTVTPHGLQQHHQFINSTPAPPNFAAMNMGRLLVL